MTYTQWTRWYNPSWSLWPNTTLTFSHVNHQKSRQAPKIDVGYGFSFIKNITTRQVQDEETGHLCFHTREECLEWDHDHKREKYWLFLTGWVLIPLHSLVNRHIDVLCTSTQYQEQWWSQLYQCAKALWKGAWCPHTLNWRIDNATGFSYSHKSRPAGAWRKFKSVHESLLHIILSETQVCPLGFTKFIGPWICKLFSLYLTYALMDSMPEAMLVCVTCRTVSPDWWITKVILRT